MSQLRAGPLALTLLAGAALAAPVPAAAAELSFPVDDAIARALLPYSPLIFDLAVAGGRSFAEISYDRRGYDPVTNTFFVTGLRVKRDMVDLAIARLRADFATMLVDGIEVDTRPLDLPPQLRDGLRRIGRDRISGDMLFSVRSNAARSAHDIAMRYDLPDIGAFELAATIDNFHVLVPLSGMTDGRLDGNPTVSGSLVRASAAYEDYGLMGAAVETWAGEAGISAELLKAGMLAAPMQFAAQVAAGLPGGVSPELRDRIFAWAGTAEAFLRDEDAIRVAFEPSEPVPLQHLQSGVFDEALIVALNPRVTHGFAAPAAAAPEPGSVAEASALVSGLGAPQDREAGARRLLALAASGDLAAVRAIAARFGSTPAPELAQDERAAVYGHLLVARALDGGIADSALAALAAGLRPDAVLAAERAAAAYFAAHGGTAGGGPIDAGTIGDHDADALRAAAYDYYEGRGVPRSFTRALTLALVASAAGDPFAASLRDSLVAAAQRNDIVLDAAAAQAEAAGLWDAFRAAQAR